MADKGLFSRLKRLFSKSLLITKKKIKNLIKNKDLKI